MIIEREKEWEVKQILNKRKVWEKNKFLVQWKGFIVNTPNFYSAVFRVESEATSILP